MLSFGKAPAKSCGRGNSSTLPDYLPEDDEDTVISDKVSKEYPTQQTLFTCSRLFKNRVSKLITAQLSHACSSENTAKTIGLVDQGAGVGFI